MRLFFQPESNRAIACIIRNTVSPLMYRRPRSLPHFLRFIIASILLISGTGRLSATNYELAVASKTTEIQWKQADLQAAQRELAIINQFLGTYAANAANLDAARHQLVTADGTLATINQNNLVKLTLYMGIQTLSNTSDAVNLAKSAASALITTGLTSYAGAVGLDRLQDGLKNSGKAALGLDDDTLLKPRTVKIKAVSDAARASFPELAKVQDTLKLKLAAVRSAAWNRDGITFAEGNDTGPILYKNGMVREEITLALAKLDALATKALETKTEADTNGPPSLADVDRLTAELAALKAELDALKALWSQEEAAARLAANQAALTPPVNQGPAAASVAAEPASDYTYRHGEAVKAAALARWSAESPALLAAIAATKALIVTAQSELDASVINFITNPEVASFINSYGGATKVDAGTTASYSGSAATHAALGQRIIDVAPTGSALPGMIAKAGALADLYTVLFNQRNLFDSLAQMVTDSHATVGDSSWNQVDYNVGSGQVIAEGLAVTLKQHLNEFPAALANANAQLDQLALATDTWSEGIGAVSTDMDSQLVAAETALATLISRGAAWETLLAAAGGLVIEPLQPAGNDGNHAPRGRLGYYLKGLYVPVVLHAFDMPTYNASMLAAIGTPGPTGLAAARALRAKYDVLAAAAPAIKTAYDAALLDYEDAYAKLAAYAGEGAPHLPLYDDWSLAAGYTSVAHPVDASSVTDQAIRYSDLYHTSRSEKWTNLTGDGPPVDGAVQLCWSGLPAMKQLSDPGLDDPANYLPHRMVTMKAVIVEDGATWIPLPSSGFDSHYLGASDAIWVLIHLAESWTDDWTTPGIAVGKLMDELLTVRDAYFAAHPLASITVQPLGTISPIAAGGTHTLSVTATSDLLAYQWSMSMADDANGGWQVLTGATTSTLTTPALNSSRWFHVTITNPGGTVTSNNARVEVSGGGGATTPVFTSAGSASGQVGTPFTWTFTTTPVGMISLPPSSLPPGLTLTNATLSGTPTSAGTWDLGMLVTVANAGNPGPGNPGGAPATATQTFRLTITLPPFDAWAEAWSTPTQRLNPAFTNPGGMPAGDGVANLLKYAFNLLGNSPGQVASLDSPCGPGTLPVGNVGMPVLAMDGGGHVTLLYLRRKAATQPGITYVLECSSTLAAGSWAENPGATEAATSVDATWERVLVTDSVANPQVRFVRVRVNKP